jgi:hypothetical protein
VRAAVEDVVVPVHRGVGRDHRTIRLLRPGDANWAEAVAFRATNALLPNIDVPFL